MVPPFQKYNSKLKFCVKRKTLTELQHSYEPHLTQVHKVKKADLHKACFEF